MQIYPIKVWVASQISMCLLEYLVTCEDYYVIVSYAEGCVPYEGECIVYCIMHYILHIFLKKLVPPEGRIC